VAYNHCIIGSSLPLIYGLAKITIIEVIMLFWQIYKVTILKNLSWFLKCLRWSFNPPCLYYQRSHIASHCGIKKCPNQLWRNVGLSWLVFPGSHTTDTFFLLKSKDYDSDPKSFPFPHLDLKFIAQTFWCHSHILPLLKLFDIGLWHRTCTMFQEVTHLVWFFFSDQKMMIEN
jgi:hypothetical protein